LVTLAVVSIAVAGDAPPYERSGSDFYFPTSAAYSDQMQNSLRVTFAGGTAQYIFRRISESGEPTMMNGSSDIVRSGSITISVNGSTYQVPSYTTGVSGGGLYRLDLQSNSWDFVSFHNSNLVASFQQQYINWLAEMRGLGYPVEINPTTFETFLTGISPVDPDNTQGSGGTPGPSRPNPPGGGGQGTTTIGGSGSGTTTTTSTAGNTTVTNSNTQTYNYTYNYITNNNSTGGGSGGGSGSGVDLAPVVSAINQNGQSTVNAIGNVTTAINNLSATLTTHGDPGTNALAAGTATAPTDGAEAADTLFGSLHNQLSLAGGGAASLAISIPFPTGAVTYTVSSTPEPGSALDQFRIILRACLTVLVGIAFVYLCIKTLRYY
jgi:hypothetical protein